MAKRKQDKKWLSRVADLGCIICRNDFGMITAAEIHHTRFNCGMGQRADDRSVIPLCFHHHSAQGADGFHKAPRTWQEKHGTERELLAQTLDLLETIDEGDL